MRSIIFFYIIYEKNLILVCSALLNYYRIYESFFLYKRSENITQKRYVTFISEQFFNIRGIIVFKFLSNFITSNKSTVLFLFFWKNVFLAYF